MNVARYRPGLTRVQRPGICLSSRRKDEHPRFAWAAQRACFMPCDWVSLGVSAAAECHVAKTEGELGLGLPVSPHLLK